MAGAGTIIFVLECVFLCVEWPEQSPCLAYIVFPERSHVASRFVLPSSHTAAESKRSTLHIASGSLEVYRKPERSTCDILVQFSTR